MNFEVIVGATSKESSERFWSAMSIWLKNPHLVNRRISCCANLLTVKLESDTAETMNALARIDIPPEIFDYSSKNEDLTNLLNITNKCTPVTPNFDPLEKNARHTYLLVNKYLPRDSIKFSTGMEFIIVSKEYKLIFCHHRALEPEKRCLSLTKPYKITFDDENYFAISVQGTNYDSLDSSINWLRDRLFPRLLKWIENNRPADDALVHGSLNLVSSEKYTRLYDKLKQKYGTEMVKKWPECTDPNKFVYEDVAIAAYLLLLWENERIDDSVKKQSFVDLGCGNGLLVYILTSEGHSGTGFDLRKRKIWSIYPPTTRLVEKTIVPSSSTLFPNVDWLIGNHSDELTPWIPVIAARSSYACRFFLLPCCAHEFDGRKFQRDSSAKSQYFEYMNYVRRVCEDCGFITDIDKLRIPSTKRICLVGRDRTYPSEMTTARDKIIDETINARSPRGMKISKNEDTKISKNEDTKILKNEDTKVSGKSSQWSSDFKPRDSVERVRNCTRIDRKIIDEIINVVASELLRKVRNIRISDDDETNWNAGGQMKLSEIARIIAPETLRELRNECGGLQTLLRNNGHIFRVIDGNVRFRVPGNEITIGGKKNAKKRLPIKAKPCWFYENHPDGCPASQQLCSFKH